MAFIFYSIEKIMKEHYSVFLSVVINLHSSINISITARLTQITELLSDLVSDYELIIVDNGSTNHDILLELKKLTAIDGLPNLQVYSLTREIDSDTLEWLGLENALGDYVTILDFDDIESFNLLSEMLENATNGYDVVFARNILQHKNESIFYRIANGAFNSLYRIFNKGLNLNKEAPRYRLLNKRVVNFILQHHRPAIALRYLPVISGFSKTYVEYKLECQSTLKDKNLFQSIARGLKLLVSSTSRPMRLVTLLSLFGAGANFLYSIYVLLVYWFGTDISEGWTSMSLQISGMFFLISLVLFVLGEYILYLVEQRDETPKYYIAQELTSARILRHEKLNIEEDK